MTRKTKTPALSTQLKAAQAQIADLTKKLEQAERSAKYADENVIRAQRELDAVHLLLDAMPNPPPRVAEQTTSWGGKTEQPVPAATRLSVLLATR